MNTFYYADIGDAFKVGFNLESWALPLHLNFTLEHHYRSVEVYVFCLYFQFSWSPSDNGSGES